MSQHRPRPPPTRSGPGGDEMNALSALFRAGQWGQLESAARGLTARHPGHAAGWKALGLGLQGLGRLPEAVGAFSRAAALAPRDAGAQNDLGTVFRQMGRLAEAEACFRRALDIDPGCAEVRGNLGAVLRDLGRPAEAEASYRQALAIRPDHAGLHCNLGNLLRGFGRLEEAEVCYRKALAIRPDYVNAQVNLGNVFEDLGRLAEAEICYRRAIGMRPDSAQAHNNLGNVLKDLKRFSEAEASYRRALAIRPDDAGVLCNLAGLLKDCGRKAEGDAAIRRALEIRPDFAMCRSNLLLDLLYDAVPPEVYCEEALAYGRMAAGMVRERFSVWRCTEPAGCLRVGLVSGDLRRHPVGYFVENVLAHIDPARIELVAYPTVTKEDDLTARLRPRFAAWRPLAGLGDEAAARLIHADGPHVLLDLSGHLEYNRLPVFAWRPAPVQASWMGYVATTGVAEMDGFIADPHVAPPSEQAFFTERLRRLPETWLCFTPPGEAGAVGPLPAWASWGVTFGCFNNLKKMNDAVVAAWARILRVVPGSRLFLKTQQLADPNVREAVLGRFAVHGIGPERLLLEGHTARREDHYASYGRVDIALDPFPFVGITTSVECLWMGVPFVTRRGDSYLSRTGESILHNAGLADWIAADEDDYVAKAVAFAADLDRLSILRAGLREQVRASPLFDAPRFARNLEEALWGMWEERGKVEGGVPGSGKAWSRIPVVGNDA